MQDTLKNFDLYYAIESENWENAFQLLASKNGLKNYVDEKTGYNALHLACFSRHIPLQIIKMIVAKSPSYALAQDNHMQTPLVISLRRATNEVSLALLQACPQAAKLEDIEGHAPLYYAIQGENPIEVIISLLRENPYALTRKLLCVFYKRWNMGLREVFDASKNCSMSPKFILNLRAPHRISPRRLQELYEKTVVLTKSYYDGNRSPLLHSSIHVVSCPWSFCELILKINPEQIWQQDIYGNHALHIAVSSSYVSTDADFYLCNECKSPLESKWYQHKRHNYDLHGQFCSGCVKEGLESFYFQEKDYSVINSVNKIPAIINSLVTLNPNVASVPDSVGKLPLHQAIESSHSFDSIQSLFHASPSVLQTRDLQSHLTPFMSAAVERGGDKLEKFSSCFAWLMEDPVLVSSGIL